MRIQLEFDEQSMRLLERLKQETGLNTHKELFNNALTLFDWAVRQRQQDRIIASMNEETRDYKELQMPALEYAASETKAKIA